jgi:hypothetical protein
LNITHTFGPYIPRLSNSITGPITLGNSKGLFLLCHQVHNAYRPDVPFRYFSYRIGHAVCPVYSSLCCAICLVLGEPGLVLYVVECQVFFFDFMINVSYVKSFFLEFSHIDIAW